MFEKGLCIILQGIPGSGKSTLAEALRTYFRVITPTKIFSTDNYHINSEAVYVYDKSKTGLYHKMNQTEASEFMRANPKGVCIVDNTNITCLQAKPYVESALLNGYDIQFIRVCGHWNNIHSVPEETIQNMKKFMEDLTIYGCLKACQN